MLSRSHITCLTLSWMVVTVPRTLIERCVIALPRPIRRERKMWMFMHAKAYVYEQHPRQSNALGCMRVSECVYMCALGELCIPAASTPIKCIWMYACEWVCVRVRLVSYAYLQHQRQSNERRFWAHPRSSPCCLRPHSRTWCCLWGTRISTRRRKSRVNHGCEVDVCSGSEISHLYHDECVLHAAASVLEIMFISSAFHKPLWFVCFC